MEVKLNKNGWHRRLQEYVFRNPPRYPNLCPYFWLTNFCILFVFIIPIVPLIKTLRWIFVKIALGIERLINWIDRVICQPMYDNIVKGLPEGDIVDGWLAKYGWGVIQDMPEDEMALFSERHTTLHGDGYKARNKREERFDRWRSITPDWEKKLAEYREKRKAFFIECAAKRVEEEKKKDAKDKARREYLEKEAGKIAAKAAKKQRMFNNIVKYTKMITPVILILLALTVGYFIAKFFYWLWSIINWVKVGSVTAVILKYAAIIIVLVAVIIGLSYLLHLLIKKCKLSAIEIPGMKYIAWPFVQFWKFLCWIGRGIEYVCINYVLPFFIGIAKGFQFFGQYVKATKGNYCPHIDWVEDKKDGEGR